MSWTEESTKCFSRLVIMPRNPPHILRTSIYRSNCNTSSSRCVYLLFLSFHPFQSPSSHQSDFFFPCILEFLNSWVSAVVYVHCSQSEACSGFEGISQLKKKWVGSKRQRAVKKWASLFISQRGEYVAVAAGNQITILNKDDSYMETRGIFTGDEWLTSFMHGAWSDSHGVLAVIDDMNTLYFIKSNGEEITRIMKKQLKTSASIIGIIMLENPDVKRNFSNPKVAISPLGNYIASLDLTGNLYIFRVDGGLKSVSVVFCGESCYPELANLKLLSRRKCLSGITDFSWWSDHILFLAKRTGAVTIFNIHQGREFTENDLLFSIPVMERVQEYHGCVFLLDCTFQERRAHVSSRRDLDTLDVILGTDNQYDQLCISRMHWKLLSFSERSATEMYSILISSRQYQAALSLADRHGLDQDEVFKSQWLHSDHGTDEIRKILPNINDQNFIASECIKRVGPTEESVKALLSYGLRITDKYQFSEAEDERESINWHFRTVRLQLLQYRDKLETFVGINMGRFSAPEYYKFRVVPLNEAAANLAESGKIGALNLLFKRHPYSLAPYMLDILAAIPETVRVQTYSQLLPGRSPPNIVALRERDWVECDRMINFINKESIHNERSIQPGTELILKQFKGLVWPSVTELSLWYRSRAREIDALSGQVDNCVSLVGFACQKGIVELQQFHEDLSYLSQLIYSDVCDDEISFNISVAAWEQLADYEKFKTMLKGVKEVMVVGRLLGKAIPFMNRISCTVVSPSEDGKQTDSFLIRWLKEMAAENELDICLTVIEEGCRNFLADGIFKDKIEAVETTLQCIYLCTLTDRWNLMTSVLLKLPQITLRGDTDGYLEAINVHKLVEDLEKRVKLAEGHVPKPMGYFLRASSDEKGVKQLLRLILSKFGRRQPSRSDNEWANMWLDIQCLQEKAFPFLDSEYMLMEFCRGLLKAGKFSLARNYLKGTGSITLPIEKAENLVIQAAREYFFSASSLSCAEERKFAAEEIHWPMLSFRTSSAVAIWKAQECLNIFPNSKNVKAEADVINVLTVKLPNLGVTLLPMQFRQIRNPMEIINMAITSQTGGFLDADEIIEIAKLLGLSSQDDVASVQEAIAREAAVRGDLQQAFDLCLVLARKSHGSIWDLCAAIARGPALDNVDTNSRKLLLGFSLSHCDEESVGELLHAWKDLDLQSQCEKLMIMTATDPPEFSVHGSSIISQPALDMQDMVGLSNFSEKPEGSYYQDENTDREVNFEIIKKILSAVVKDMPVESGVNWDTLLRENGKVLSFAALQLPWLLELSRKEEYGKKIALDTKFPEKLCISVRIQAVVSILSWLAQYDIAPNDKLIASLAKSIMEPPVTEEENILGSSFLLNLVDAFHGVELIEEQLKTRRGYEEICSIMSVGMTYSFLNNSSIDCSSPAERRKLLLHKFQEKLPSPSSGMKDKSLRDEMDKLDNSFWMEWKLKLEQQKRLADQTRVLEQIMPGVDTTRFLSGDSSYIKSAIFSFIDSAKLEKKPILKKVLTVANSYDLNISEVLLHFLASALVSEVWSNDDVEGEISNYKEEIFACASEVINLISAIVYPAIDGHSKQRLAYVYEMLSSCYSQLKGAKEPLLRSHHISGYTHTLELSQFFKIMEKECRRVAFIKTLNFKNIAGFCDLNFQHFNEEVYANINESSVEALAKMVEILTSIYKDPVVEGLISWEDVYKHHVLSSLGTLESEISMIHPLKVDDLRSFLSELEQNYNCGRIYIRSLSEGYLLDVVGKYYSLSLPHYFSGNLSGVSEWSDCLIILLNFWIRMLDDIQHTILEISGENHRKFDPERLLACLKVFKTFLMEGEISANDAWVVLSAYAESGLMAADASNFCRAMIFSGCGFNAVARLFSKSMDSSSACLSSAIDAPHNLVHIYVNITDSVLLDLGNDFSDSHRLHSLLTSLSKLEGNLEDLKRVRCAVWNRLSSFSENMHLQSRIRVYALELMQAVAGKNLRGVSDELLSDVLPWVGWDESHFAESSEAADQGGQNQSDVPSRLTNTLVALKSTQLVAAISSDIEIASDDLMTLDSAVSCFLRISATASSELHFEVLQAVLEEWETLFITSRKDVDPAELDNTGNDWSTDDWDEGWESFPEEAVEKEAKKGVSDSVHPLHACWMVIGRKLIGRSQLASVMKLIDHSLSKPEYILLTEDEARGLSQLVVGADCFMALKMVLLLPYEAVWFQCLAAVEAKLKGGGIQGVIHGDYDLFILILNSGVFSKIVTDSSYSSTCSYFCRCAGHLSRKCQEAQLSLFKHGGNNGNEIETNRFHLFNRILFPSLVAELVKAKHLLLAAFLVSQFMHIHASLSLINVAEACLRRYLEGQIHTQQGGGPAVEELHGCSFLVNSVSKLRVKLESLLQSATSVLPNNGK
ncbi:hypothetical protein ACLOJK_016971 [Asimina triloba]